MLGSFAASYFLITLFFSLLLSILWLRIFLRFSKISTLNSISKLIYSLSNALVRPIENLVYSKKAELRRYDGAALIVIVAIEFIKFIIISFLLYKALMPFSYILLFVLTDIIVQPCQLLFYLILIRVIMSWINPYWHHPVAQIVFKITEPLLALGRYLVPNIAGYDLSPFIILVFLKVVLIFMTASLPLNII